MACVHNSFTLFCFVKPLTRLLAYQQLLIMEKWVSRCSSWQMALGISFREHPVLGSRFTANEVDKELANVKIEKEDIVILYITSHGAKSKYDSNIFHRSRFLNLMFRHIRSTNSF